MNTWEIKVTQQRTITLPIVADTLKHAVEIVRRRHEYSPPFYDVVLFDEDWEICEETIEPAERDA